ncbi:hypothetical protein [Methylobacterium komagatae]
MDWSLSFLIGLLMSAVTFTAGVIWGQKTGPPKNWSEAEEPPDRPPSPTE